MKRKIDPYKLLTHAMMHCQFGSETVDRPATQADMDAVKILLEARKKYLTEKQV